MQYSNGRVAQLGDLVRGKGYNLRYEFTGILVAANPANTMGPNCKVYTMGVTSPGNILVAMPVLEEGQLDSFVAIDPGSGEILQPTWQTSQHFEATQIDQLVVQVENLTKQGEKITMSVDTLNAKIQELVDAQKATSASVTAEIAKLEAALSGVAALPVDTTAMEATLQSAIDGLKATTAAADAAAVPTPPTPATPPAGGTSTPPATGGVTGV